MNISQSKFSNTSIASNSDNRVKSLLEGTSKKLALISKNTKGNVAVKRVEKPTNTRIAKTRIKQNQIENERLAPDDLPLDLPTVIGSSNEGTKESQDVNFPHITTKNWNKFENILKKSEIDEITKKLDRCLARMHGYEVYDTHFTSLHFVRLSIVDCLINRKWNNLLKLVIMLSRNYSDPVFTMLIRHLCQILKHYHPAIRGTDLEDQIDLIVEKHEDKRNRRTNMNNSI